MKKTITIVMLLITVAAFSQQTYQKNKHYYPFVSAYAAKATGNLWIAIDAGVRNNSTEFRAGLTSHLWDKSDNIAAYVGIGKRVFTINRFEGWGKLSTSTNLTRTTNFSLNPQAVAVYNYDKALRFNAWIGTNIIAPTYKPSVLQGGIGLTIVFMGNVNNP